MTSPAWHEQGVVALQAALRQRSVGTTALTDYFLARLQAPEAQGLGAVLALRPEASLAQAQAQDAAPAPASLAGVPVALTDTIAAQGWPTTAGSRMLAGYVSPFHATLVQRLEQAGAITVAKLVCDEFGMDGAGQGCALPPLGANQPQPLRNPWNRAHSAGGASGSAAVAVAAGLVPAAVGSDSGGDVLQPASWCGVTALRPTYGRISRFGLIPNASSFDQASVVARSAQDCAAVLSALCGPDLEHDATSLDCPAQDFSAALADAADAASPTSLAGLRIGLPTQLWGEALTPELRRLADAAVQQLVQLGATVVPVSLPLAHLAQPVADILGMAEAASNLSRFDGVRYGYRAPEHGDIHDLYRKSRTQGLGREVQRRLLLGTYALCEGAYETVYVQAQKVRQQLAQALLAALADCDLLVCPGTTDTAALLTDAATAAAAQANTASRLPSVLAALAGLPALSLPAGHAANGLPVGLQLLGRHFGEAQLLHTAHCVQQATDWHQRLPL